MKKKMSGYPKMYVLSAGLAGGVSTQGLMTVT